LSFPCAACPSCRTRDLCYGPRTFPQQMRGPCGSQTPSSSWTLWLWELALPTLIIPGEKAAATLHFPPPCLGCCVLPTPSKGLGEVDDCHQRSGDSLSPSRTTKDFPRGDFINDLFCYESCMEIWPVWQ